MEDEPHLPTSDELIANAAKFLIEGDDNEAASIILACTVVDARVIDTDRWDGRFTYSIEIDLSGPRAAFDAIKNRDSPIHEKVLAALSAVQEHNCHVARVDIRSERIPVDPDWRQQLIETKRGGKVHNQAATAKKFSLWRNLRFRSQTEVRIAEELDRRGATFFPLCMARLNGQNGRVTMEPDFLVCNGGKWGILEVDGEPYHPAERAAVEHERDRLFRRQGITVERYDATRCYNETKSVVEDFLRLLR